MRSLGTRLERCLIAACCSAALASSAGAQDLEPRRWSHQPVGTTVAGLAYAYTDGDLQFDPVLDVTNATLESHRSVASVSHWFAAFERTARFDVLVPYERTTWSGLLSGVPESRTREGLSDPWVRLSWNFLGSPALDPQGFRKHYAKKASHTVAGVALGVMLPLGNYDESRLFNVGQNRFVVRPQIGVVHRRGAWSFEATSSLFWYSDNDSFFGGRTLEQDPMVAAQGHVVRTFSGRWWASVSAGYSFGGETRIDGVKKDDERSYVLSALSVGMPIGDTQALKFVYTRGDTKRLVGLDANTAVVSWSVRI